MMTTTVVVVVVVVHDNAMNFIAIVVMITLVIVFGCSVVRGLSMAVWWAKMEVRIVTCM